MPRKYGDCVGCDYFVSMKDGVLDYPVDYCELYKEVVGFDVNGDSVCCGRCYKEALIQECEAYSKAKYGNVITELEGFCSRCERASGYFQSRYEATKQEIYSVKSTIYRRVASFVREVLNSVN